MTTKPKSNITRGMRDMTTIQGLRHKVLPKNREQAVTELARLEHEKARLECEIAMWVGNQRRTEARLHNINQRLALLETMLHPDGASSSKPARTGRRSGEDEDDDDPQSWHEVSISY